MLNKIEENILFQLVTSKRLRFTELKPDYLEADLYNYYLRKLISFGLVTKSADGYAITDQGKRHFEETSETTTAGVNAGLFKVRVLLIVYKDSSHKQVLVQKRTRHPFFGETGIIAGSIKKGERVIEAAQRVLTHQTGLLAEFSYVGLIRKIRNQKKELFSDSFFHVLFTDSATGTLIEASDYGLNSWDTVNNAVDFECKAEQGSAVVCKLLENEKLLNEIFYQEETTELKTY